MENHQSLYLKRPGEHLLLEGYRSWNSGLITGNYADWDDARQLYCRSLGTKKGRLALFALAQFLKALGLCVSCPLKTSQVGCPYLCRDEALILGLLSGIQHGEETTVALCLDALVCSKRVEMLLVPAEVLAVTLRSMGKVLLPVPADAVKAIITESASTSTLQ